MKIRINFITVTFRSSMLLKVVLILLLTISNLTLNAQKFDMYVDKGDSLAIAKSYAKAGNYYDSAILIDQSSYYVYYNSACVSAMGGKIDKSVQRLTTAFDLGFDDFDYMYYDKELDAIRQHEDYQKLEAEYRDPNTIYFFDIIQDLLNDDWVSYRRKRISIGGDKSISSRGGDFFDNYEIIDIYTRLGIASDQPRFDFSDRVLQFLFCDFETTAEASHLRFLKLKRLEIVRNGKGKGNGDLVLSDIEVGDLVIIGTDFKELSLRNIILNGLFQIQNTGNFLSIENSSLNIQSKYTYQSNAIRATDEMVLSGITYLGNQNRFVLNNIKLNESTKTDFPSSFQLDMDTRSIEVSSSVFNMPLEIKGSASKLDIHSNIFNGYIDISNFIFPEFNSYMPYDQFNKNFVIISGYGDDFEIIGDDQKDLKNVLDYDRIVNIYKLLHNNYRNRGEIKSANNIYRKLKSLEISYLILKEDKKTEEAIRLRFNQIMGFYTDYGTNPGKALIISFYIIFSFSIIYFFFPSEWDKESKSKLIYDFKIFVNKNEHGYIQPLIKCSKGLLISFINAFTLSINAFVTLGFGRIPTTGLARYICVLQGFLGWFLLSLFTVALINQVLL